MGQQTVNWNLKGAFLRAWKNKSLKEEIVTKIGLYDLVKFHDPGIQ